jgi:hypothetical protein
LTEETGEKVSDGCTQVAIREEISDFSHIEKIVQLIKEETKQPSNYFILIDFYQLLRKDPD